MLIKKLKIYLYIFINKKMTDSCFLCLMNTKTKQCTRCNLHVHYKCWKKYLNSFEFNETKKCPQCKEKVRDMPKTRARTHARRRYLKQKDTFTNHILSQLSKCERVYGRLEKEKILTEIFDYLLDNMDYLLQHKKLNLVVRGKLKELYFQNKWYYAKDIYFRMYGTIITQ
jgi:hypothetical protein